MPDATCRRCRKTIRPEDARTRCPFCGRELTAAAPPAESRVTVGRHASIRTLPPPERFAAAQLDEPLPPFLRRKRGRNDARIAVAALLLVGLMATAVGTLPHFWRPRVGPTPPPQLTLPVNASPASPARVEATEPALPIPPPTPEVRPKRPPEPVDTGDPRTAHFRAKLKSLEWLYGPPQDLTYSADLRRAAFGSRAGLFRVWDVEGPKELCLFTYDVACVAFSPDASQVLAADRYGDLRLWDLTAGVEVRRMDGGRAKVGRLVFSPDGAKALSGSEGPKGRTALRMWDLKTGREETSPVAWRAEWAARAAATVPNPSWPPCAAIEEEATTTAHTLHVPYPPVEAEGAGPADAPLYLLSTTIGNEMSTEIVEVDGGR